MKRTCGFLICLCALLTVPAFAAEEPADVAQTLTTEISNGTVLDVFPLLPPLHLPAGITVHLFMLLFSSTFLLVLFLYGSRLASAKPGGVVLVLESLVLFVRDDIVFPVMGARRGERWLPFFCTLFVFLLTVNLLGLFPAFKTATGNINVTSALALMILILLLVVGLKNLGPKKFLKNFYPEGTALPIGIFVAFLEFTGVFIKTAVLSLRLFANMFAGHLAILSFLMLIFLLNPLVGFIAVPFTIFTYVLEIVVGVIQALVFTLLSCIFITMASSIHE